jgi:hypothetical protein
MAPSLRPSQTASEAKEHTFDLASPMPSMTKRSGSSFNAPSSFCLLTSRTSSTIPATLSAGPFFFGFSHAPSQKRKPRLHRCIKDVGEVICHNLKTISSNLHPSSKFWSKTTAASERRSKFSLAYILFLSHLAFALMQSAATSCAKYEKLDAADQKRWYLDDTWSLAALDKQGGISLRKFSELSAGTDPFSVFYEALTGEKVQKPAQCSLVVANSTRH